MTTLSIITGSNYVHEILGSDMCDLIERTLIIIHKDSVLELDDILNFNKCATDIKTTIFTYLM